MELATWSAQAGRPVRDLAAACGVTPATFYRYIRGLMMPRPETVARIESATLGAVTAADLTETFRRQSHASV